VARLPELLVLAGLAVAEARAAPRSAADCDAMVRAAPHALASYRCYWDLAHTGRRMEAEQALEAILRREPENPGALHFLGLCRDDRGRYPEDLLRRSVAAYQRSGEVEGEVTPASRCSATCASPPAGATRTSSSSIVWRRSRAGRVCETCRPSRWSTAPERRR
jgi:hypothetical protein